MNILFLSELFYPHGSGAELATYLYAKLLGEAEFNVIVVTNGYAEESQFSKNGNLIVYRLPLFRGSGSVKYSILQRFDVLFSSFMRKMVKWADVVYIPRFWFSAIPLAKAYGKPIITHLHDYIPICPLSNIYDISKDAVCNHKSLFCPTRCIYVYEKTQGRGFTDTLASAALNSTLGRYFGKFVKLSHAIICVSTAQRDIITKREPFLREKTYVIYNPLPQLSYINIEGDDFGYFGGPNYLKGFHILYHAMMHINWINHKPVNIHATKFPKLTEGLVTSLSQLAILPYGKLSDELYRRVYEQIRAVVVPSIWPEPYGYVIGEAILRGRVVIASDVGGIPELVDGCKGAFLFRVRDYKQLANKIRFVNSLSREIIIDLGVKNRKTFLKKYKNEESLQRFVKILEKIVD